MEGTYACNLNNRFEMFLDNENDPLEILAKTEQLQAQRKSGEKKDNKKEIGKKKGLSKQLVESVKTIAAAVDSNAPPAKPLTRRNDGAGAPSTAVPPRSNATEASGNRGPPRTRGTDYPSTGGERNFERRNNERNFEQPQKEWDRAPREYRPAGAFRGGRAPRGGGPGGFRGREFDRRSGDVRSGVKSVDKRGGQGSHNWGSAQADAEQQLAEHQAPPPQAPEPTVTQEIREPENNNAEVVADGEGATPAEPEVVEMTLEQWKKEQAAKKSKAEYAASIRKPNEGEKDDPKLKKAVVLRKKITEESDGETGDDTEESEDEGEKLKKQLEQTLASQFRFADQRGGPGGAPRGRGPRGPGGPRGPPPTDRTGEHRGPRSSGPGSFPASSAGPRVHRPQQQHTPRVEDLNDFPSLAA